MEGDSDISYIRGQGSPDVPYIDIPSLMKLHAERTPDAVMQIAVDWETFEKETLTFSELYNCSMKLAKGLHHVGVKKGDIVALGTDNTPEWMVSMIGAMMCGASCLLFPFNRKDGKDVASALSKIGERCKIMIFPPGKNDVYLPIVENIFKGGSVKGNVYCETSESLEKAIIMNRRSSTSSKYLTVGDVMEMNEGSWVQPQIDPENTAVILMTSGSTGTPKLIPHSHLSLLMTGFQFSIGYGVSKGKLLNDRIFSWIGGFPCWEITTGGTRVYLKHVAAIPSIDMYLDAIQHVFTKENIDGSLLMPRAISQIAERNLKTWNLKNVSIGGRPVSFAVVKYLLPLCRKLFVLYGSTEVCMNTYFPCEKDMEYPDFICGKPFPGVEVKVVDKDGVLLKRGTRGEAYVRSVVRFNGYLKDEERTSAVLDMNGWYRMGDSTIMTVDGNIIVEGRIADSLIESGDRLLSASVSYIESHLIQNRLIKDVEVLTVNDRNNLTRICCAIIWEEGTRMTDEELEEYLMDSKQYNVTLYSRLDADIKFFSFENFPKTHNGKVDRKEVSMQCQKHLNG
ncbi:hypothetical protein FSP39_023869 [Pinctada imbricata]|uniref:AMP-dependent synthetase/ligase domain-containing protein n=1 Tax=Pinctada imbricata TaxID=66713 RepID=A0AA88YR81_PINIB|nr:hypothetical protein FSP39_023869 [Pinctada imbricata]